MTLHLYLVRHGETKGTCLKRYGDYGLSEQGKAQVDVLSARLRTIPLTHIYSSPLLRTRQTAQTIAQPHNLPVALIDDLREVDIGAFDGLTFAQARQQYPHFFAQSRVHPTLAFGWPGGEDTAQVLARAQRTWQMLWARHRGGDDVLCLVSHTYYLGVFLLAVLGLPFSGRFLFKVELGGCVHVAAEGDLPPWIVFDESTLFHQGHSLPK